MLAWLSDWSDVQTCIWPSGCHCHSLSLALVKSTWVVPDKGPLNACVCCSIYSFIFLVFDLFSRFLRLQKRAYHLTLVSVLSSFFPIFPDFSSSSV